MLPYYCTFENFAGEKLHFLTDIYVLIHVVVTDCWMSQLFSGILKNSENKKTLPDVSSTAAATNEGPVEIPVLQEESHSSKEYNPSEFSGAVVSAHDLATENEQLKIKVRHLCLIKFEF